MKQIERIYQNFEGIDHFKGQEKLHEYAKIEHQKVMDRCKDEELLDIIHNWQSTSVEEAFLDGLQFGMKILLEL